jgi:hypothetical protein
MVKKIKVSSYRNELGDLVKASYSSQKDAQKLLNNNYTIDKDLSKMNSKVFLDNRTNKPVILHRGTTTLKDVFDDGLLAVGLGKYSGRNKQAKRLTKKVEAKYNAPATAIGHSLGGWLAERSGGHGDILTYNKAVGLGDIGTKKNKQRQFDVSTRGDIVSGLGITQNANKEVLENKNRFKNPLSAHGSNNLYL